MSETNTPTPTPAPVPTPNPAPTPAAVEKQVATLAASAANTVLNAPPGTEPNWAKPATSILILVIFCVLVAVSYFTGDKTSFTLLCGVGASMAQQVVGYYLGSSSGSAHKTALLAAAPPVPPIA